MNLNYFIIFFINPRTSGYFLVSSPAISGNTSGLLGFWDGDKEKEFLLPNGTFLDTNSSQITIHYEFGQQCKLFQLYHNMVLTATDIVTPNKSDCWAVKYRYLSVRSS